MTNTENKFEYNGLIYITVEGESCRSCYFDDGNNIETCGCTLDSASPWCCGEDRQDGRSVCFVRSDIDNKGKAK